MAQMAPALTEANASPGSPRKNSVDRYCSSTVPEDLKQNSISKGVDLTLLSGNGLVRLLDDSDSSNNITNTTGEQSSFLSSPPKSSIRNEGDFTTTDMPNGHLLGFKENDVALSKSTNISTDDENRKPAILSQRACASSTATTLTTPAGTCNIECDSEKNTRTTKHPVATFNSCKSFIPERTARSIRKQARLESRARKLEKRLRKLQTRQIETHVHRQLNGIVDHLKGKNDIDSVKIEGSSLGNVLQKKENLNSSKDSILSSACAISHEIDNGVIAFQAKDTRNASSISNPTESHFENAVKYSPESVNKAIKNALSDERQKFETESLVEGLTAHVEHLEVMYDSDATEASSGDESEEDDQRFSVSKSLRKTFQLEVGEISSRWSWLQSQIINLERQIRRYEDVHKNARVSKQQVKLQANSSESEVDDTLQTPINGLSTSRHLSTLSDSSELKTNVFKEPQNHLRNGIKKSLLNNTINDDQEVPSKKLRLSDTKLPVADLSLQCARTSGIYPIRNRPLVHLSLLKQNSKFDGLSCQCSEPETPCISCCKTAKTIVAVDPMLPISDRVKMLDHSYHPVLSFSTEIPLQFHFASILKKGGFESRTKPQPLKTSSSHSERNKKQINSKQTNRRSQLAKGAAASLLSSAKYRNQRYDRKRGYSLPSTPKNNKTDQQRTCFSELPRKRRAAAISADAQLQKRARSLSLPTTGSSSSTPTSSPSPTPMSNSMPPSTLGLLLRKKRTSNAFDINNIVIPYSMASSTRVEKLQYKEILTPSWRILEVEQSKSSDTTQENEVKVETEILEDDIFVERHEICEEHERKRFLGFLTKKRKRTQRQSSELGNPDDPLNTPPGTPAMTHSPTGSGMSGSVTPTGVTPLFSRSYSLEYKLAHRRSSSTDSLVKVEGESWPSVAPFTQRNFPLSETEEASLKLPTPLPTPVPSTPASPLLSPSSSPMCSPLASPTSDVDMNEKIESEKNEWTVKLVTNDTESSNGDQPRKGIVLKLAKR